MTNADGTKGTGDGDNARALTTGSAADDENVSGALPVVFNGVRLAGIVYDGEPVSGLVFNGTKIY